MYEAPGLLYAVKIVIMAHHPKNPDTKRQRALGVGPTDALKIELGLHMC